MQPKIYLKNEHHLDQNLIDSDALYVLAKLRQSGYIAYLVGGSVRDLLMGHTPKDFDISTSARPEEIKRLFSHCLLIGKRFRLAHVRFGKKIFEVSTFRSGENTNTDLILRDNSWGSPEEDVLRRDFTINGLFYEPSEEMIIDYVGGWEDLSRRLLRSIGPSDSRFKQDPVRMIRLLKFRARFNFAIDPEAWEAMNLCKEEIHKSSPARVLEEFFRMLESGSSAPFFRLLAECGFMRLLLPKLDVFLQSEKKDQIFALLEASDQLIRKSVYPFPDRAVLVCSLLYPPLQDVIENHCQQQENLPHFGEIVDYTHELMRELIASSFSAFPRRMRGMIDFILHAQYRLTPIGLKRPHRLRIIRHPDFQLAMHFLQLRAMVHPELHEHLAFWKKLGRHKRKIKHHEEEDDDEPLENSQ